MSKKVKKVENVEEKNENSEVVDPKLNEKETVKGIYILLGILAAFVIFLALFFWFRHQLSYAEYQGLTFTKTKFGEIPVFYYYYNFKDYNNAIHTYNLYLREDPRKNDVRVIGEIEYPKLGQTVYLSWNFSSDFVCENSTREFATMGMFLGGNLYNVKGSVTNKSYADENNLTYATCETHSSRMVLVVQNAPETKIVKEKENCYYMYVSTCDKFLDAVEKFEVQSIIDGKKRVPDAESTNYTPSQVKVRSYNSTLLNSSAMIK